MGILLLTTIRAESDPQNSLCSSQSYFSSSEKCNLTPSAKILGQFFTSHVQATLYFTTQRKKKTKTTKPLKKKNKETNLQDNKKTKPKILWSAKRDYLMSLYLCVRARMCAYIYDCVDNYH